ncbi:MAG: glutamine--tRNA ligase/YqeY domain fusion protein [Magnetococcales bacterium]|nr:glutamine--tRNA ligase/YqeY domain fusion protein [Magnetococcales bacterium]
MNDTTTPGADFIRDIIAQDLAERLNGGRLHTRFPPEPNGYLHIGHAKSICLNFGVAAEHPGGLCNLRFDDTNPEKEDVEYVDSIQEDVRWLGFDWEERIYYASDYFPSLCRFAEALILAGKAYVCDLSAAEMRDYRGTLTEPGRESPYRERTVEENLDLFRRMRAGEFPDGSRVLRARIDMASPNMNMRDPALYRIRRVTHHRTGDDWVIYPTYDFAHGLSDALEGITHSLCTLEFEDHRPLYDWFLDNLEVPARPRQIEFSRLSLEYTVMSKRKLNALVRAGVVRGWDDPRMPTISGLRRRGFTPESIRQFCRLIGISKSPNRVEYALLENCLRTDLDARAPRAMAVLNPLRVVIVNFPEDRVEELTAPAHPQNEAMGTRRLFFTREILIEQEDFRESASKEYKRLVLGGEVRLRNGYVIRCLEAVKSDAGEVIALRCEYDPATLNVNPVGRKVRGVIHWVSASRCVVGEVRLYAPLFHVPEPDALKGEIAEQVNPDSMTVLADCHLEPGLADPRRDFAYQFERLGYFFRDPDSTPEHPVFNRAVSLRDTWAKIEKQQAGAG